MACHCDKTKHATRDAALDAQKRLVYNNHVNGHDKRSAGLNVYPCRDDSSAWHIGHSSLQPPPVYHYDVASLLDAMTDVVALTPEKSRRMPKSIRRNCTGRLLALYQCIEEFKPMVWFTWNAAWDFKHIPHLGTFVGRPATERLGEGLVRMAVPAYIAKLRWSDYFERNRTPRLMREVVADLGNPAEWLATDQPVPYSAVRGIDVWYRGAWVGVADVTDADFAAYLADLVR